MFNILFYFHKRLLRYKESFVIFFTSNLSNIQELYVRESLKQGTTQELREKETKIFPN